MLSTSDTGRPSTSLSSMPAPLPTIGSRRSTMARVDALAGPPMPFFGGSSSCWSMRTPPFRISVQPKFCCISVYGSSFRKQRKMWERITSEAMTSGGWTCDTPADTRHGPGLAIVSSQRRRSRTPSPVCAESMKPGQSKEWRPVEESASETRSSFVFGRTRSTLFSTSAVCVRGPRTPRTPPPPPPMPPRPPLPPPSAAAASPAASISCALSSFVSCARKPLICASVRRLRAVSRASSAASTTTSARSADESASVMARRMIGTDGPSEPGASTNSICVAAAVSVR
mmetsp:Transcript_15391/g.49544  ORF Transcript_15391/g.49544 Transcript_15391/m.49544 type:complete len:285 (+) Transcript_15391:334-1188(+)